MSAATPAPAAPSTDTSAGQPAGTPTPADVAQRTQPAPQAAPQQQAQAPQGPRRDFYTPDEMSAVRSEAAEHRIRARDASQAAETARAALAERDATIAELQQQLEAGKEATTKLARLESDKALAELVTEAKGAPIAAAAIRGDGVIDGMDLTTEDGKKTALAAITTYLGQHSELSGVQAAPRSGTPIVGGSGEGAFTKEQFDAMTAAERNSLFAANPALYNQLAGRG